MSLLIVTIDRYTHLLRKDLTPTWYSPNFPIAMPASITIKLPFFNMTAKSPACLISLVLELVLFLLRIIRCENPPLLPLNVLLLSLLGVLLFGIILVDLVELLLSVLEDWPHPMVFYCLGCCCCMLVGGICRCFGVSCGYNIGGGGGGVVSLSWYDGVCCLCFRIFWNCSFMLVLLKFFVTFPSLPDIFY